MHPTQRCMLSMLRQAATVSAALYADVQRWFRRGAHACDLVSGAVNIAQLRLEACSTEDVVNIRDGMADQPAPGLVALQVTTGPS